MDISGNGTKKLKESETLYVRVVKQSVVVVVAFFPRGGGFHVLMKIRLMTMLLHILFCLQQALLFYIIF